MSEPFITVADGHHARLSASSSHRWLKCAGSARLADECGDSGSRVAAEGTAAHALAQHCLTFEGEPRQCLGKSIAVGEYLFVVDEDMADAVTVYTDYLRGMQVDWRSIEVDLSPPLQKLHRDFGGMADCVQGYRRLMYDDNGECYAHLRFVEVVDYKHGAGVFVSAHDNPQLKYYALGALLWLGQPVDVVRITIVQPRIDSEDGVIRSFDFDAVDLVDFSADLVEAAKLTESSTAPLVPGEHCKSSFCPVRATCPALQESEKEIMKAEFNPIVGALDNDQLGHVLLRLPEVEARCTALRELGYKRAMAGEVPTGMKIIDKRAIRKYKDQEEAERALAPVSEVWDSKLKTPAQVEKTLGKKRYKEYVAPLVEKKSSGYNLVPEDHPSPPATLLAKPTDFEAIE